MLHAQAPTEKMPDAPECGYGCMNGGSCMWPGYEEEYHCMCPEGYTGYFCETRIPNCNDGDECMNGGECMQDGDMYHCSCKEPFTGHQCETEMKDCSTGEMDSMCHNGGECKEYEGHYSCECKYPFTGYQCETMMPMCDSCHPDAEECHEAPCECQGNCPEQTFCIACMDEWGTECQTLEWMMRMNMNQDMSMGMRMNMPMGLEMAVCHNGCQTKTWMENERWYIARGCAEEMCWNECNDDQECTYCCEGHLCNKMDPGKMAAGAVSVTFHVAVILASAVLALLAVF